MDNPLPFVDPRIFTAVSTTRADDVPVIIVCRDTDQLSTLQAQSTRSSPVRHLQSSRTYLPYAAARVRKSDINTLAQQNTCQSIWYDEMCSTCLDRAGRHLELQQVQTDFGVYGTDILIGFADTGLDSTHRDFADRVEGTRNFVADTQTDDPDGHGTHVASIACGSGEASGGRYAGVAPQARILAAQVLSHQGTGRMSRVMTGLEWLAASGAAIINLSVGTNTSTLGEDPLSQLCNLLVEKGIAVTVAAGNSGPFPRTIGSPGTAASVITVGATDLADQVAAYSSRGPTLQGLIKPDLLAPGHEIVAARAQGTALGTVVNEHYTRMSGTSMATPLVSGLCALMLDLVPRITPAELKTILQLNSLPLNQPATVQGAGRIQLFSTMQSLMADAQPEVPSPAPAPVPVPPDETVPDPADPPLAPAPPQGCLGPHIGRLLYRMRPVSPEGPKGLS